MSWDENSMSRLIFLLCGAVAGLAHAPVYFVPGLAGFAVIILAAVRSDTAKAAFVRSWIFGFGYGLTSLYWIGWSFFIEAGKFGPLAIPAIVLLISILAIIPAIAGLLIYRFIPKRPMSLVISTAALLIILEMIRPYITGFPWNHYASVWAFSGVTLQPLRWFGTHGYGFVTMLLALSAGGWLLRHRIALPFTKGPPLVFGLILLIMLGVGALRMEASPEGSQPAIRLVQPNIDLLTRRTEDGRYVLLNKQIELSTNNVPDTVKLVVWPETALPFDPTQDQQARLIAARALSEGMTLITGSDRFDINTDPVQIWNSLAIITPEAELLGIYNKRHLVPFGEFLPARNLLTRFGLKKLTAGTLDFSAGTENTILSVEGFGRFASLICFEVAFPVNMNEVDNDLDFLVNITIDTWFGTTSGPYQHMALARMRAVETGLPMLRAANSGVSVAFDGYGREIGRLSLNTEGALDLAMPMKATRPERYFLKDILASLNSAN